MNKVLEFVTDKEKQNSKIFRIKIEGKQCHGAMPETGVDSINIAVHIYLGLQEIIAREISGTKDVVLTIGKFSGGEVSNIIPGEVLMEGLVTTSDKELMEFVFKRIKEISESLAKAFRGKAEVIEI